MPRSEIGADINQCPPRDDFPSSRVMVFWTNASMGQTAFSQLSSPQWPRGVYNGDLFITNDQQISHSLKLQAALHEEGGRTLRLSLKYRNYIFFPSFFKTLSIA
jgi:hypothetical protein